MQIEDLFNSELIINLVNMIFFEGIEKKAKQIVVEPSGEAISVLFFDNDGEKIQSSIKDDRIGAMYVYPAVVARLKSLAGLRIGNKTDILSGKINFKHKDMDTLMDITITPGEKGETIKITLI